VFTLGAAILEILHDSNRNVQERAGCITVLCTRNGSKWNDSYRLRTGDKYCRRVLKKWKLAINVGFVLKKEGKLSETKKLTL
jgi:hypothetical protein